MRVHRRRPALPVILALAGILSTVATTSQAQADPAGTRPANGMSAQQAAIAQADSLTRELGRRAAGFYLSDTGTPVIDVLDPAAARRVRASGAMAKLVRHSTVELESARAAFDRVNGRNTSWAVDPRANQVVVGISDATPTESVNRMRALARSLGDVVRVEFASGRTARTIAGGDPITSGPPLNRLTCTAGFNGRRNGQLVVLTAGHCTDVAKQWNIGPTVESDFPGTDYGLIRNTTGSGPGVVRSFGQQTLRVTGTSAAAVGQAVCSFGATSGRSCGEVTALNTTVRDENGDVTNGMIETTVIRDAGDSGGPLYERPGELFPDSTTAIGLLSAEKTKMGEYHTYFQPIRPALRAYNVTLATS